MPELPSADGLNIRIFCGSHRGLRAHANRREPLCPICQAFVDAEKVEAERRRPTPPAAIDVRHIVALVADDDQNVVPLRRIS